MKFVKILCAAICFILALGFGVMNDHTVEFNFLLAKENFHLSVLLGGAFVFGAIFSLFISSIFYYAVKRHNRKLQRELKQLKELPTIHETVAID